MTSCCQLRRAGSLQTRWCLCLLLQEGLSQRCWAASMASCSQLWRAGFAQIVSAGRTRRQLRGLGRRACRWLQCSPRSQCSQTDTWPFTNDAANAWCLVHSLPHPTGSWQCARPVVCRESMAAGSHPSGRNQLMRPTVAGIRSCTCQALRLASCKRAMCGVRCFPSVC